MELSPKGQSKLLQVDVTLTGGAHLVTPVTGACGTVSQQRPVLLGGWKQPGTLWFSHLRGRFSPEDDKSELGADASFFSLFLSKVHCCGLGTGLTYVHRYRGTASPRH